MLDAVVCEVVEKASELGVADSWGKGTNRFRRCFSVFRTERLRSCFVRGIRTWNVEPPLSPPQTSHP